MTLDVRRLRLLREVALRGTIAAAAEALAFTPSAISQQLSALERESGATLLERQGRRVRLTDAGRLLVEHAETILIELERAQAALEASQSTVSGTVRLASFSSVAITLVTPAVVALRDAYPDLCVTMSELEPEDSLRELQLADLDLVLAYEYSHTAEALGAGLERTELFAEAMSVVVPPGWVEPGVALELDDLKAEVWAAAPADTGCGRAFRTACRSAGFTPDVRYTSADFNVILHLIEAGAAVSVLPELAFGVVDCDYQVHALAGPPLERRVFAAVRAGSRNRPSLRAALDALTQAAADRPQVLKVPVGG